MPVTQTGHPLCDHAVQATGTGRDRFDITPEILNAQALPAIGYAGVSHFDTQIASDPSDGANHFMVWPLTNYRAVEMRFTARHASVASKAATARFWLARTLWNEEGNKKSYFEHFGKAAVDVALSTSASPFLITTGKHAILDPTGATLSGQVAHIDTGAATPYIETSQVREHGGGGLSPYVLQLETEGCALLIGAFNIGDFTALRCAVSGI